MSSAVRTCTGLGVSESVRRTFDPVTVTCCGAAVGTASCARAWAHQPGSVATMSAARQWDG